MNDKIVKLSELNGEQVNNAFEVFVEGFYNMFSKTVIKDRNILHRLFKESFDYDMVYIYLQDNCVCGFLGLANYQKRVVKLKKELCQELLGKFKGLMIYKQMGAMLEKITVFNKDEAYIDYITTAKEFRGKGIGTKLIQYLCANLQYKSYTLDVLSKNMEARLLYEKVGFKLIKEKKEIITLLGGFGTTMTMKLEK